MEEDATTGRKRRELKQEKQRLTAFSERLARLVEQIQDRDNDFERNEPAGYLSPTVDDVEDEEDEDIMIVDHRGTRG
jgi:hypothetical protein